MWTREVPIVPGRYWWRCNDGNEPTLVTLPDSMGRAYGEFWPVPWVPPWEQPVESVNAVLLDIVRELANDLRAEDAATGLNRRGLAWIEKAEAAITRAESLPAISVANLLTAAREVVDLLDAEAERLAGEHLSSSAAWLLMVRDRLVAGMAAESVNEGQP